LDVYQINVAIRGCVLNLGNIALGIQYNSLDIRNSTLIQVNLTRLGEDYDPSRLSPIMMSNTNFQRGSIKMRYAAVTISQSNLSILSPPLEAGTSATISCSSIIRSPLISQANTTGIVAMDLQLFYQSIPGCSPSQSNLFEYCFYLQFQFRIEFSLQYC
jgi:hypothetical protein